MKLKIDENQQLREKVASLEGNLQSGIEEKQQIEVIDVQLDVKSVGIFLPILIFKRLLGFVGTVCQTAQRQQSIRNRETKTQRRAVEM